jgi:outer membrane protein assembly factor BamB
MGRTPRLLVGCALASLSLSGCWLQVGYDAAHTRHNTAETTLDARAAGSLTEAWSADLLARAGEPLVKGDRVFVVSGGTEGYSVVTQAKAFAAADGAEAWEREWYGAGSALFWQPSFVGDELWTGYFMVSFDYRPHGVYAGPVRLDPDDGTVVGSSQEAVGLSAPVDLGDQVVQSLVTISGPSRRLVVTARQPGATSWVGSLPGDLSLLPGPPPAVDGGRIFVGDSHYLSAFPQAGCGVAPCDPDWSLDLGTAPTTTVAPAGSPFVFVTRGDDLVAVDRAGGTISWTAPLGAAAPGLAVVDDDIFVGAGTTFAKYPVAGCGAATCEPTARVELPTAVSSAPVAAAGVVYVGKAGAVQAFDTDLGPVVSLEVPGSPTSMAVAGGRLFVITVQDGGLPAKLVAFTPRED